MERAVLPKRMVYSDFAVTRDEYQLNSQTEKARDHYDHDYDADYIKDVHLPCSG